MNDVLISLVVGVLFVLGGLITATSHADRSFPHAALAAVFYGGAVYGIGMLS